MSVWVITAFVLGAVVSVAVFQLKTDPLSNELAKASMFLHNNWDWLEAKRLGNAASSQGLSPKIDERPVPGSLVDVCDRLYLIGTQGSIASGYSVSLLETKSAAALASLIERHQLFCDFKIVIYDKHWVVLIWYS